MYYNFLFGRDFVHRIVVKKNCNYLSVMITLIHANIHMLQTNFTSVIGILKGTEFGRISDRLIGIGAHYDTVNSTKGM